MEPVTMALIGGTLLSGLTNLLSGDPEQEKKDKIAAYLKKRKEETESDYAKILAEVKRISESQRKDKKQQALNTATQFGLNSADVSYEALKGIDDNEYEATVGLEELKKKELKGLDDAMLETELSLNPTTPLERFFSGAVEGLYTGSSIASMLSKPSEPDTTKTETDKTKIDKTLSNPDNKKKLTDLTKTFRAWEDKEGIEDPYSPLKAGYYDWNRENVKKKKTGMDFGSMGKIGRDYFRKMAYGTT